MQQNAKVTLYQREIQVIRMDWYAAEGQEARERMDAYLKRVLEDLQKWKQEGLDEDELNRRAEDFLQTRNLIQIMAPLEDCRIIVYKPRKESLMRTHKLDYFPWDEVCRWSGGEEYSICLLYTSRAKGIVRVAIGQVFGDPLADGILGPIVVDICKNAGVSGIGSA